MSTSLLRCYLLTDVVSRSLWRDVRLVPVYVAGLSALLAVLSATRSALLKVFSDVRQDPPQQHTSRKSIRAHIASLGGTTIFTFRVARLVCVCALLVLYAFDLVRDAGAHTHPESVTKKEVLELVLFLSYVRTHAAAREPETYIPSQLYASGLAVLNIAAPASLARTVAPHLVIILLASCVTYGLRDIWPLMTYTLRPLDVHEGAFLWIKIALLAIAGIVIPLTAPRLYVPLDPEVLLFQKQCMEALSSSIAPF